MYEQSARKRKYALPNSDTTKTLVPAIYWLSSVQYFGLSYFATLLPGPRCMVSLLLWVLCCLDFTLLLQTVLGYTAICCATFIFLVPHDKPCCVIPNGTFKLPCFAYLLSVPKEAEVPNGFYHLALFQSFARALKYSSIMQTQSYPLP